MKNVILNSRAASNCEGVSRRDVVKVGALSFFGLSLPQFYAMRAAEAAIAPKAEAVILFWCGGGPSHVDSFDPQPEAPSEIRGEFSAIPTNVDGIRLSEHLPNTAKIADKIAIIRSLASNIAAHEQASQYLMTGYKPLPTLQYPSYGSMIAKELGVRNAVPPYIGIPNPGRGAQSGFIGAGYNPFSVPDPAGGEFRVQDVNLPRSVDDARLARRRSFTKGLNTEFSQGLPDDNVRAVDQFYDRAYDLVTSQKAKQAFDLQAEPAANREKYGASTYGQGALLARRLVEVGARFVTVSNGGWDTHTDNFSRLSGTLLPGLDRGFATLVSDLQDRGMLEKTLVIVMGEFGRTPRINPRGGRDHFAKCRFATFAGAGVKGGQVIGKSDFGQSPVERPVSVEEIAATIYSALGIDYTRQIVTPTGRPIHLADGKPIPELWG
jgi:hypothetical protein